MPEDNHVRGEIEEIGGIEDEDKHIKGLINDLEEQLSLDNNEVTFLHLSKEWVKSDGNKISSHMCLLPSACTKDQIKISVQEGTK